MSYLPREMCITDLNDDHIYVKIRGHQKHSSLADIYSFIKSHSLKKKDVKRGWRDKVSRAFQNITSMDQFDRLVNIVLTFENRTYGPDKSDQFFLNALIDRRNRRR